MPSTFFELFLQTTRPLALTQASVGENLNWKFGNPSPTKAESVCSANPFGLISRIRPQLLSLITTEENKTLCRRSWRRSVTLGSRFESRGAVILSAYLSRGPGRIRICGRRIIVLSPTKHTDKLTQAVTKTTMCRAEVGSREWHRPWYFSCEMARWI